MIKEIKEGLYKIKEGCYLKAKDKFGEPAIVYPVKDYETNKFIWKNFLIGGSWVNFIIFLLIIIIIFLLILAYKHDMKVCMEIIKNPYSIINIATG